MPPGRERKRGWMWILKLRHRPTFVSKTFPGFSFTTVRNPRYVVCPPTVVPSF